jgi:hypothetical protein
MRHIMIVLCVLLAVSAFGQMPKTLNYQGTLSAESKPVPDGDYTITFRLYTGSSGGTAVWDEKLQVTTRNGVFNAILGKVTPLPASFNTSYWMSLQPEGDTELSPRLEMTGVSYSLHSLVSDSATKIADGAVTAAKIADATITGAKVASSTLTADNILDEPGVSSSVHLSTLLNAGNILYVLDSVDITLPSSGVVVLMATGYVSLSHLTGARTGVVIGINNVRTSITQYGSNYIFVNPSLPTGAQNFPFSATMVNSESAGTRRFYLLVNYTDGLSATTSVYETRLTAMYFPTQMGTLSKSTPR